MHIDLDIDAPDSITADVAVIGGGAAGITMARRLLAGGRSVVLLESGGLEWEGAGADLRVIGVEHDATVVRPVVVQRQDQPLERAAGMHMDRYGGHGNGLKAMAGCAIP